MHNVIIEWENKRLKWRKSIRYCSNLRWYVATRQIFQYHTLTIQWIYKNDGSEQSAHGLSLHSVDKKSVFNTKFSHPYCQQVNIALVGMHTHVSNVAPKVGRRWVDWNLILNSLNDFYVSMYNCNTYRCLQFWFTKDYENMGGTSMNLK